MKYAFFIGLFLISGLSSAQTGALESSEWVQLYMEAKTMMETQPEVPDQALSKRASKLYTKAIKLKPNNELAYFGRGVCKLDLLDYEGAIKDFETCLKISPVYIEAETNLGLAYYRSGNYPKALYHYNSALQNSPDNLLILNNRSLVFSRMGRTSQEFADLCKIISIDSTFKDAFTKRAYIYDIMDSLDLCKKDLESAMRLTPNDTVVLLNLAFLSLRMEDYAEAEIRYKALYETKENNPYVLSNYGYLKHIRGDTETGIEMIKMSLEIIPDNSYAYKYLAKINLDLEDKEKACAAITKGLELGYTELYGRELEEMKLEHCQ